MEKSNHILHNPGKRGSHSSCTVWANPYYQRAFEGIMSSLWGPRKAFMLHDEYTIILKG